MTPKALSQRHIWSCHSRWLLSLSQSWAQALIWSPWSQWPLCRLSGAAGLLVLSVRDGALVACQPSVVPPHWYLVTAQPCIAPGQAHTPLAKSSRNASATGSQLPSQSLSLSPPSCVWLCHALEAASPVLRAEEVAWTRGSAGQFS